MKKFQIILIVIAVVLSAVMIYLDNKEEEPDFVTNHSEIK